jgi:hypothetical protein
MPNAVCTGGADTFSPPTAARKTRGSAMKRGALKSNMVKMRAVSAKLDQKV